MISKSQFGKLIMPGLRQEFMKEYQKWPGRTEIVYPRSSLLDLPDNMSYDEIADVKEAGELNQLIAKNITGITYDYDTGTYKAQYENQPTPTPRMA